MGGGVLPFVRNHTAVSARQSRTLTGVMSELFVSYQIRFYQPVCGLQPHRTCYIKLN